ncbi:MAG TPA: UDP-3-O-(3-hydroxymyristoyl)glucosamine N-acyltransferase [Steroidobacteraceae bacterium]|nr:UDP-3-O-(3-hydroxymyristoyl)glucosamine N-acyltransferase [Steroidobacteraceae bacterium]
MSIALGELAVRFGCALRGDPQLRVDHVAALGSADPQALSFLANPRLTPQLSATRAGAVVLEPSVADCCPVAALIIPNPHALFARIATLLHPVPPPCPGVHARALVDAGASVDASAEIAALAVVAAGARIGPRCRIGPGCVIGADVQLGADCRLGAHVTLEAGVRIGVRALIHPGAVIGSDGFGLAREDGRWLKVPQVGSVLIGDDVEIGANTTIDRGAIEDTVIADGVKLDNLIQVGHNVHIGAHTAIAACTGISGSTRIGARCMIGGGVGFNGHIEICDDVVVAGMSTVTHAIREPGYYGSLIPAEPMRQWKRAVAKLKQLGERDALARAGSRDGRDDG